MKLPGKPESYWMDSTPETAYPALESDMSVDVAVIGAGIAGLCTAWELVRAGRTVAVLEADRIVGGVTGYTTAKLTAQHTLSYARIAGAQGEDAARCYALAQQDAVEHVARTAADLGIDCDFARRPAYTYTEMADEVGEIRAEAEAAAQAGLPASLVTATGLPYPVAAAVRVDGQAQFHPRRYLLGLADAITAGSGTIVENTRVVDLDEGDPCRVATAQGYTVSARDVVVATHYPIFDRALLFTRLRPHRELVVAGPIDADRDPGGMYLTTADNLRSVRTAPTGDDGGRLLIVTGEKFTPGEGDVADRYARLIAWVEQRFPGVPITYRWAAQDNATTDGLPYVGPLHPGAHHSWVATGFGGWGMSNGVMSGRLLAASIAGEELPWTKLFDPRRLNVVREAGPILAAGAQVARHFVGDRLRRAPVRSVDELDPGDAAVLRIDGDRRAVYRDGGGNLHTVSATCTHLGCIVGFNDAETAWECPCHGSRFDVDGAVLHGPATRPLDRYDGGA